MALPTVILTEGITDDNVFEKLIEENKLGVKNFCLPRFSKNNLGGKSNFWLQIKSVRTANTPFLLRDSNAIIIVADNDCSPKDRFGEIQKQIEKANKDQPPEELFGVPQKPRESARRSETLPPIHILMLPWDDEPGCLETLCIQSANSNVYSNQMKCGEQFAKCIGTENWKDKTNSPPLKDEARIAKFRVQSLLTSICDDPYTLLKSAWNEEKCPSDIFLLNDAGFSRIVDFLRTFIPHAARAA